MGAKIETLSDRLNLALITTGTKKIELARAIDVTPQVIQFLCNSQTKSSRFTFEIAAVLGLSTRWLATGEGPMFLADDPSHQLLKEYNQIPVLTEKQIIQKQLGEEIDVSKNKWMLTKSSERNMFCYVITDASMEPTIPRNAFTYFCYLDTPKITQELIVLAYLKKFGSVVVRTMVRKKESYYLTPLNSDLYKDCELNEDVFLVGQLMEVHWQYPGE